MVARLRLGNLICPLARTIVKQSAGHLSALSSSPFSAIIELRWYFGLLQLHTPWISLLNSFNSLTDTQFYKRWPRYKLRRKRASLKPPGPYGWVQYTLGEPIATNNPNEKSVKRMNEKKRMRQ